MGVTTTPVLPTLPCPLQFSRMPQPLPLHSSAIALWSCARSLRPRLLCQGQCCSPVRPCSLSPILSHCFWVCLRQPLQLPPSDIGPTRPSCVRPRARLLSYPLDVGSPRTLAPSPHVNFGTCRFNGLWCANIGRRVVWGSWWVMALTYIHVFGIAVCIDLQFCWGRA